MTREIQLGFYGAVVDPADPHHLKNPQAFVYPLYVVFLFAPFEHFSFNSVRAGYCVLMFLLTAFSFLLWLHALRVRLRPWTVSLGILAVMSSYAVLDGLGLEQLTLLVGCLVAGAISALEWERPILAGALLALGMVKPQLVIILAAFLLLWTLGEWRSRKWFAFAFGGLMTALLVSSQIALPGWFRLWRQQAHDYLQYVKPSLLEGLLGSRLAVVGSALTICVCGLLFWRARREAPGSAAFNFALTGALVGTTLLLPNAGGNYHYHVLLIPAVIWLFEPGKRLAGKRAMAGIMWVFAVIFLVGEWVLATSVSFAALILRHAFQHEDTFFVASPELLMFFFPLILALFLLSVVPQMVGSHPAAGE